MASSIPNVICRDLLISLLMRSRPGMCPQGPRSPSRLPYVTRNVPGVDVNGVLETLWT
jgi:hypothetical protein